MSEMTYIAATGALGAGVDRDSLFAALDEHPRFIAADAGTTDAGAFALGAGETAFSRAAVKRDLSLMLQAGLRARVPVIVGAAGAPGWEARGCVGSRSTPSRTGLLWRRAWARGVSGRLRTRRSWGAGCWRVVSGWLR